MDLAAAVHQSDPNAATRTEAPDLTDDVDHEHLKTEATHRAFKVDESSLKIPCNPHG